MQVSIGTGTVVAVYGIICTYRTYLLYLQDMSEDTQPPPLVAPDDDKLTTPTGGDASATSSNIEFPLTHFYELESRVHTDQWSIPYKRDESLAICMVATIRMIREGDIGFCLWGLLNGTMHVTFCGRYGIKNEFTTTATAE